MKQRLFEWIASGCLRFLEKYTPERLEKEISSRGRAVAQETATKMAMEFLHREGLLTCAVCPQRYGLRYGETIVDGEQRRTLFCIKHYPEPVRKAESHLEVIA